MIKSFLTLGLVLFGYYNNVCAQESKHIGFGGGIAHSYQNWMTPNVTMPGGAIRSAFGINFQSKFTIELSASFITKGNKNPDPWRLSVPTSSLYYIEMGGVLKKRFMISPKNTFNLFIGPRVSFQIGYILGTFIPGYSPLDYNTTILGLNSGIEYEYRINNYGLFATFIIQRDITKLRKDDPSLLTYERFNNDARNRAVITVIGARYYLKSS